MTRLLSCIILGVLFCGVFGLWSAQLWAQTNKSDDAATAGNRQASQRIKVALLYPEGQSSDPMATSFAKAIQALETQLAPIGGQFPLEILTATFGQTPEETATLLQSLVVTSVAAVILPTPQLEFFVATTDKQSTLLLDNSSVMTNTFALIGDALPTLVNASTPALKNQLHQLRFSGNIKKIVLLYDEKDSFGQACFPKAQELLEQERFPVIPQAYSASASDFSNLLNRIKLVNPEATLFVCALKTEAQALLTQARQKSGLQSQIIGLTLHSHLDVLDLSTGLHGGDLRRQTYRILAQEALAGKLAEKFPDDPFAAQTYLGLWVLAIHANWGNANRNNDQTTFLPADNTIPLVESPAGKLALLGLYVLPDVFKDVSKE